MTQMDPTLFHMAALLYNLQSDNIKREHILRKIIESMIIINGNKMLTIDELTLNISQKMSMTISSEEIQDIVCSPQHKGFAVDYSTSEIKFCLKPNRYDYIMNMNTRNMDSYIKEFIQLNNYSDTEKQIIEAYLYDFYRKNFNDLQHALGNTLSLSLSTDMTTFSSSENTVVQQFLNWENDGKNSQLLALANYALEYTLVAGEANQKKESQIERMLSRKNLYIDTNVLFYCLGINGETYEESNKIFLRKCKSCNENIIISYYTNAELRSTFAHFEEELNRLNSPLIHNTRVTSYITNKDIYQYYIKWASKRNQLKEARYFIRHLYDKYEALVKEFGIIIEHAIPFPEAQISSDEKLLTYEAEIIRTSVINYDARNIYYIESKRKSDETTLQTALDIFISADRNLQNWDMHREKNAPVVVSPNTWLLLLTRLAGRSDDDFKCFISYINQANSEPIINNKEFFEVLKTICEIIDDVKQQESVIDVMVEEEFAFLYNKGEKRTPEFIQEKTQEKAYSIMTEQIKSLSSEVADMHIQIDTTNKQFEEKSQRDVAEISQLKAELIQKTQEMEQQQTEFQKETEQKNSVIQNFKIKERNQLRIIIYSCLFCVITLFILAELYSILIAKNQNPLTYQVFYKFYQGSLFDTGNPIEIYGKFIFWVVEIGIGTADAFLGRKIWKLIQETKALNLGE